MLYKGIYYTSNEHFYQSMKFSDVSIKELISAHPSKGLKAFCREFQCREDWDSIRVGIMKKGLLYKFNLPRFKELLLSTGDAKLVEGNYWHDTYWGVCDGEGKNILGKLLMNLRTYLRKEGQ